MGGCSHLPVKPRDGKARQAVPPLAVGTTSHIKLLLGVDSVNIHGYPDVDTVDINESILKGEHMLPFFVLLVSTLVLRVIGMAGVSLFDSWTWCLRCGFALMFLFTASAHWGERRGDLIAMVPRIFPRPDLMVSATGVLELLGGLGLLIPALAHVAAAGLALLLIALLPANIRAAREHLTIAGRPVTALPVRALLQLVFIVAVIAAGFPGAVSFVAR